MERKKKSEPIGNENDEKEMSSEYSRSTAARASRFSLSNSYVNYLKYQHVTLFDSNSKYVCGLEASKQMNAQHGHIVDTGSATDLLMNEYEMYYSEISAVVQNREIPNMIIPDDAIWVPPTEQVQEQKQEVFGALPDKNASAPMVPVSAEVLANTTTTTTTTADSTASDQPKKNMDINVTPDPDENTEVISPTHLTSTINY